jgi:hypothetical protein
MLFGLIGNTVASGEEAAIMAKIMESAGSKVHQNQL